MVTWPGTAVPGLFLATTWWKKVTKLSTICRVVNDHCQDNAVEAANGNSRSEAGKPYKQDLEHLCNKCLSLKSFIWCNLINIHS